MGSPKITARIWPGLLLGTFAVITGPNALAQDGPARPASVTQPVRAGDMKYAAALHLAYIRGNNSELNTNARSGLEALAATLTEKTAVEPAGVVALDVEQDNLALFPFIYWPVGSNPAQLSDKAQRKVQQYLDNGGFIVFDINDVGADLGSQKALRHMLGNVSLKPLVPMAKDHLLTKTFYAVAHLRGSFDYGTILVNAEENKGAEEVSSVIIGENNWAGAWAGITLPESSRERDLALRAGINMVFYALSGNYKADQARILDTLDKLDRK
jgi:hypothetical protein